METFPYVITAGFVSRVFFFFFFGIGHVYFQHTLGRYRQGGPSPAIALQYAEHFVTKATRHKCNHTTAVGLI